MLYSVGDSIRFVREAWRFVATVAGMGVGAVFVLSLLAQPLPQGAAIAFLLIGAALVYAGVFSAYTRAALTGPGSVRGAFGKDFFAMLVAMSAVAAFLLVVLVVSQTVAMAVLIAPYAEQVSAVAEDETAARAVMNQAIEAQPGAVAVVRILLALVWLWLTTRFFFAAPASIDAGRPQAFQSWVLTRGIVFRVIAARIMIWVPATILWAALVMLAITLSGVGDADPPAFLATLFGINALSATDLAHISEQAQAAPGRALGVIMLSVFLAFALLASLEAALASTLYRAFKTPGVR